MLPVTQPSVTASNAVDVSTQTTDSAEPISAFSAEDLANLASEITNDPIKAAKYLKDLRREAKTNRVKSDEYEKLKSDAEKQALDKQAAADKALAEQGKYQELLVKRENELATLKESAKVLETYKEYFDRTLKARLDAIPKEMQKRIPPLPDPIQKLQWIEDNADLFATGTSGTGGTGNTTIARTAPNLDQGVTGNKKDAVDPTLKARELMQRFGINK